MKYDVRPGRDPRPGGLGAVLHRVWRLFPGGRVPRTAAVELAVPPPAAGVPAGVRRRPPEAAGVPAAAPLRRHRARAGRPAANAELGARSPAGRAAAVRGHGRPEEGDVGSAAPAAGAEAPEGGERPEAAALRGEKHDAAGTCALGGGRRAGEAAAVHLIDELTLQMIL